MERKKVYKPVINNAFYDTLNDGWQTASNHPVALLRAENALRNPWIAKQLPPACKFLDIGCGAGFLANYLARLGHNVHGIDLSRSSLDVATKQDATKSVTYQLATAYALPYPDASFDAVAAMDLLEHVEEPEKVIAEAARVLRPNGLFFFHTFNKNFLSYLTVIKGVEWCVQNTPARMHVYSLFIKPADLSKMCARCQLSVSELVGVRPNFKKVAFWKMVVTRKVPENFTFEFTHSLRTGYSGVSRKEVTG